MSYKLSLALLTLLVASAPVYSESWSEQKLLALNDDRKIIAEQPFKIDGRVVLASFFTPDCQWCRRQHKVLSSIQQKCPTIKPLLIGLRGDRMSLLRALKRDKIELDAYLANHAIRSALSSKQSVPLLLGFSHEGALTFKLSGFKKESQLINLLFKHGLYRCNADKNMKKGLTS